MTARLAAYRLIERVEKNAYSNIALSGEFRESGLSERDKAFAARLFYGVTERRLTLEHIMGAYSSRPAEKLDRQVRIVLMMGIYQLMFMDNVPDSAAVNESAELIKRLGMPSAAGFVNGVLRNIIRDGKTVPPAAGDEYCRMSVEYSCPRELIERICGGYGEDNARSLLAASLEAPVCTVRVNTLKTSAAELAESFSKRGITAEKCPFDENALYCGDLRDIENDPDFRAGFYHVQDHSSQLCCRAADPKSGDTVIDLCAAPGGKTFTMAQMMENSGRIFACELHEKRTRLMEEGLRRLGITCAETVTGDARVKNAALPPADVVLCDVPCSGYGVIRSKPEIKYKPLSEADRLPEIQLAILLNAADYVKAGGILIYSTCTVNINENERVAERFLEKRKDFSGDMFPDGMGGFFKGKFMTAVFTKDFGGDGFFICRMKRGY
ncbi:MAG: 16S rRNA (cytosine(967)-C(5))-methyltransferase RsmB [Ruminococcus sp.]|nr:16S rRNA (cytosine(967)-C(5))-methyltransferase RsmB [Ruminococcus sp.]